MIVVLNDFVLWLYQTVYKISRSLNKFGLIKLAIKSKHLANLIGKRYQGKNLN
jgi:hypothetical protein